MNAPAARAGNPSRKEASPAMKHRKVEPDDLRDMLYGNKIKGIPKMTYAQIAEATGLTESGVAQAVRRYKLQRKPRLDHKWAVPWSVLRDHSGGKGGKVYKYLRDLSVIAQGGDISDDGIATAIRWAQNLVDQDLDIDYDRDQPPNDESIVGGFFTKPADESDWHLKKVLNRAKAGLTRKL
ncbi:hypothetical protein [Spirillospora sp. NPDC047279]|uniref:hypothetical protein n=1 Tax=Spirillospora sp. NPDC047279 TaxID=3155478 RepID=UPI0033EBC388